VVGGFRADADTGASARAHFDFQRGQKLQRHALATPSIFDEDIRDVCICAGVISKKRIIVFFNPSTAKADSLGLRPCHSNAAILFGSCPNQQLGVVGANLTPRFQIGNVNPLVLLYCLDKPNEGGKVRGLKGINR
jgi:hypothetical protein